MAINACDSSTGSPGRGHLMMSSERALRRRFEPEDFFPIMRPPHAPARDGWRGRQVRFLLFGPSAYPRQTE
jgi:hypothetical protein